MRPNPWRIGELAPGLAGRPLPTAYRLLPTKRRRSGITLTEILIGIMILGVGLVSLATLFPIGLMRLREATRFTRSAFLLQTAAADMTSRGMINGPSFLYADNFNLMLGATPWYQTATSRYNPMVQDTPSYGGDWSTGVYAGLGGLSGLGMNDSMAPTQASVNGLQAIVGPGLPFAYDPLWRYQTIGKGPGWNILNPGGTPMPGYYPGDTYEARFASGIGFLRPDNSGGGSVASAHGLQRITNFHWLMPAYQALANAFVSQDDLVWQDPNINTYTIGGISPSNYGVPIEAPSPIVPDLSPPAGAVNQNSGGATTLDWRYSWMFTGQLTSASNPSCFEGDIVIFENRPFSIAAPTLVPYATGGYPAQDVQGETVVEGVFGYSTSVNSGGYAIAADRTVLLRWSSQVPDPVVHVGDWIADVTYERNLQLSLTRFYGGGMGGYPNPSNKNQWDNLPPQRCWWYRVEKVSTIMPDPSIAGCRSVTVTVNQPLRSRTVLNSSGQPAILNAALIAPNVINVIPQTIFLRASSPTANP